MPAPDDILIKFLILPGGRQREFIFISEAWSHVWFRLQQGVRRALEFQLKSSAHGLTFLISASRQRKHRCPSVSQSPGLAPSCELLPGRSSAIFPPPVLLAQKWVISGKFKKCNKIMTITTTAGSRTPRTGGRHWGEEAGGLKRYNVLGIRKATRIDCTTWGYSQYFIVPINGAKHLRIANHYSLYNRLVACIILYKG